MLGTKHTKLPMSPLTSVRTSEGCRCGFKGCSDVVENEGIQCETCEHWYHPRCGMVGRRAYAAYQQVGCLEWVCPECKDLIVEVLRNSRTSNKGNVDIRQNCIGKASLTSLNTECVSDLDRGLSKLRGEVATQGKEISNLRVQTRTLEKIVNSMEKNCDLALGRNRNVIIDGIPEPVLSSGVQRERGVRYHVTNLLRMVQIPEHVAVKRVLRLGKWDREASCPRSVVVEFANPRHRDTFLAESRSISTKTGGRIIVRPDASKTQVTKSHGAKDIHLKEARIIAEDIAEVESELHSGTRTPVDATRSLQEGSIEKPMLVKKGQGRNDRSCATRSCSREIALENSVLQRAAAKGPEPLIPPGSSCTSSGREPQTGGVEGACDDGPRDGLSVDASASTPQCQEVGGITQIRRASQCSKTQSSKRSEVVLGTTAPVRGRQLSKTPVEPKAHAYGTRARGRARSPRQTTRKSRSADGSAAVPKVTRPEKGEGNKKPIGLISRATVSKNGVAPRA